MTEDEEAPYVLKLGMTSTEPNFPLQFATETISHLSAACTPIEILAADDGAKLAHASGFFWRSRDRVWLVTARHNLTGKDNFTGAWLGQKLQPRAVRLYPAMKRPDMQVYTGDKYNMRIVNDSGEPFWSEDPEYDSLKTDIACIDLVDPEAQEIMCLNDGPFQSSPSDPGDNCFVLGYPNPSYEKPYAPIWRRATIAMDVIVPVDDKPIFLLDCSTSRAMSGAPVLLRSRYLTSLKQTEKGIEGAEGWLTQFVGVYGGRLQSADPSGERDPTGEIAYAYYANRVDRIIEAALVSS